MVPHTHLGDGLDLSIFGTAGEVAMKNTGKPFGEFDTPKTLEQGSATTVVAAFDPSIVSDNGSYLKDSCIAGAADFAKDEKSAEDLWKLSEELVGEKFAF